MTQTAPAPAANPGSLRFLLTLGAWFVGLFGLMRLDWVENVLLTPFAQIQQQVADQLTGAHTDLLYFNGLRLPGSAWGVKSLTCTNLGSVA